MDLKDIIEIKIFPGIGVGRVGNSDDYFIGPEAPNVVPNGGPTYDYGYKDSDGNILRQAARYRVYGLDRNGNVVAELKEGNGISISWDVHLTNKKAANYAFQGKFGFDPTQFRNPGVQVNKPGGGYYTPDERSQLIIDPGSQSIHGSNKAGADAVDMSGTIFDGIGSAPVPTVLVPPYNQVVGTMDVEYMRTEVSLGRLETDEHGRLIIVPGAGKGESRTNPPLPIVKGPANLQDGNETVPNNDPNSNGNSYFNNPGWYDDTAGGSVNATVVIPGVGRFSTDNDPAKRGWFASAPPNYGPSLYNVVSLLDLQLENFPEADPNSGQINAAIYGNDSFVYTSASENGSDFSPFTSADKSILGATRPSIAHFKGNTYLAVRGRDGSNYIGKKTSSGYVFTVVGSMSINSTVGPSITVFNNRLYYAVTGTDSNDKQVYLAYSSDGTHFCDFQVIPVTNPTDTKLSPSLAAYNGNLYLSIVGTDGTPYLGVFELEQPAGTEPSVSITFRNILTEFEGTQSASSITAFDGQLFYAMVSNNGTLYLARWNNNIDPKQDFTGKFTLQTVSSSQQSNRAPALAAFNGKLYYGIITSLGEAIVASADPAIGHSTNVTPNAGDLVFSNFGWIDDNAVSASAIALADAETINFYRDIYPILKTVTNYAWVNQPAFNGHGPGSRGDFLQPRYVNHLANPEPFPPTNPLITPAGQINQARQFVFGFIRPAELITDATPPPMALPEHTGYDNPSDFYSAIGGTQRGSLMPHLFGEGGSDSENHFNKTNFPNQWLSLTRHQLSKFQKWINGDFETGSIQTFPEFDDIPLAGQPMALNFAALQPTVGGGFHPGIELTYNLKYPGYFAEAFRFADEITFNGEPVGSITPGSVAAYMSCPWHGDFWSCNISWWAAMRPDIVLQDKTPANPAPGDPPLYVPENWFRGDAVGIPKDADNDDAYLSLPNRYGTTGYLDMAKYWCKFGFVTPKVASGDDVTDDGETVLQETERDGCLDDTNNPCSTCDS